MSQDYEIRYSADTSGEDVYTWKCWRCLAKSGFYETQASAENGIRRHMACTHGVVARDQRSEGEGR